MSARRYGLLALFLVMSIALMAQCEAASDDLDVDAGADKAGNTSVAVQFDDASIVSPSPLNESCTYTFSWDFDYDLDVNLDGVRDNDDQSGERSTEWTYHRPGVYLVTVTLTESGGEVVRVAKDTLKVVIESPWIYLLDSDADSLYLEQTVRSSALVSVADDAVAYPWNGRVELQLEGPTTDSTKTLGEWNVTLKASGTNASYAADFSCDVAGNYSLRATLYDHRDSSVDTETVDIEVLNVLYNPPPSARIALMDKQLRVGELAYFSASESNDTNGFIQSYSWDMGDGSLQDGVDVSHLYSEPGFFSVRLVVLDNEGKMGDSFVVVEVIEVPQAPLGDDRNGSTSSSGEDGGGGVGPQHVVAASLVVVLTLAVACATEVGKTSLLILLLPLYTRLRKKEVLDQFTRGKVYGYIIANPGDHYNSIRGAMDISNGTLAYHLQVLEREELIKSRRDGVYRRFYPYEMRVPSNDSGLKESQMMIIRKLRETPGVCQREIASFLGITPSTVNYHMQGLLEDGLVVKERHGMRLRYFLSKKSDAIGL